MDAIDSWLAMGETAIALATVIDTWGSAPRKVGAKMAFTTGGTAIAGSVSGGCVESAVIEAGDKVLATGRPQLLHFGVADETAWGVGLACGGSIDVFVERLDLSLYAVTREKIIAHDQVVIAAIVEGADEFTGRKLIVAGDEVTGTLGGVMDEQTLRLARQSQRPVRFSPAEGITLFIDVVRPSPVLVIVGGAHIAVALAQIARIIGYRTLIVDPRRAFGSEARFPGVDQIIPVWPEKAFADMPIGPEMAVVTLSHDPKIDDPALRAALQSEAFYIGALGSRKTHTARRTRLAAMGFTDAQLARIHAPIGLDIGADNPEEIGLAIMSEIVAANRQRVTEDE